MIFCHVTSIEFSMTQDLTVDNYSHRISAHEFEAVSQSVENFNFLFYTDFYMFKKNVEFCSRDS